MLIRLPIDTKSLYFNIKNDNATGHTPTVATPLKQGNSIHREIAQILRIPEHINPISRENLISHILSKSRAEAKITRVFVFDKVSVNGHAIPNSASFCIYIREEIGKDNIHCGRQKVHYPVSLEYSDLDIEISNRAVYKQISKYLHDYAFLIEAFEFDEDSGTLNLDATIIGENNIPYSKVFVNKRGVGKKFSENFSNSSDTYDTEIIALRKRLGYDKVGPDNFEEVMAGNDEIAYRIVENFLLDNGCLNVRNLKAEYPYALYDIEYILDGRKKYAIIKQTATANKYFTLPLNKIQFCNDFKEFASMILITDINGEPQLCRYTIDQLNQMDKAINAITYFDRS